MSASVYWERTPFEKSEPGKDFEGNNLDEKLNAYTGVFWDNKIWHVMDNDGKQVHLDRDCKEDIAFTVAPLSEIQILRHKPEGIK